MQEWFQNLFAATLGLGDLGITVGLVVSVIVKIVIILIPLILTVAYLTISNVKSSASCSFASART
ncbi:NADH-quinone oxidoreductase subunit H domain protein [Neisseria meningitidis 2004264]|nr:NADH-quinone oxidoreductase subunit H domain protein [Neisseria meningitidis 2004264]EOC37302.1 NADH-quinone oxidoreductase subunit H domain protein [Neisseria meningitidis 2004264]EOC40496.1 NADH-quinone oxidoreductase subunit H domain protein [Neisseria meningitidis 2004264]EOC40538.1 NADH-quinone oxidoreductase subunit H domain protein [Neisseria meningitidis 2004264]